MASTHAARTILASTTLVVNTPQNGTEVDNTTGYGLLVMGKCTNGSTGPSSPAQMQVYVGEASGTKRLWQTLVFDLGDAAISERGCQVPYEAMFVNVTFTGVAGHNVIVECYGQHGTGV